MRCSAAGSATGARGRSSSTRMATTPIAMIRARTRRRVSGMCSFYRDSLGRSERRTNGRAITPVAQGETRALTPGSATAYIARMAVRDILIIPDKRLRLQSEPLVRIDKPLRTLVDDMFETMYAAPGIGLAAIQVGVPQRLVTLDLAK